MKTSEFLDDQPEVKMKVIIFLAVGLFLSISTACQAYEVEGPVEFKIPILNNNNDYRGANRNARHFFRVRQPLDRGIHYAWQNPIKTAPTLPPQRRPAEEPQPTTAPGESPKWWQDPNKYPAESSTEQSQYPTTRPQEKYNPYYPNPTQRPTVWVSSTSEYYQPREDIPAPPYRPRPDLDQQTRRPQPPNPEWCPPGSLLSRVTRRCHELGSKEPCNENMVFYKDPDDRTGQYGLCDCINEYNRPLVYHPESDKCYFIFQQAYCKPEEWLILDPEADYQPVCAINRCMRSAGIERLQWNWTQNGPELDTTGVVAILPERICSLNRLQCTRESSANESLRELLRPVPTDRSLDDAVLQFEGPLLVCKKARSEFAKLSSLSKSGKICKPGLYNKWRLKNRCRSS